MFLCAFYSLSIAQIELFQKLLLSTFLLFISAVFFFTRVLLLSGQSIVSFSWSAEIKQLSLYLKNGERLEVESIRQSVVTPVFIFLKLDVKERLFAIPLLIFFDSCSYQSFRRLKVLARYATLPKEN
ncbi:MAG: protein YgfX [Neptuniibacter sp.]